MTEGIFLIIIKLNNEINDTRNYFLRLLLGKKDNVSRDYAVIGNKRFDIYSMTCCDLSLPEVQRILRIKKGKLLESLNTEQNELLTEYLVDKKPYYKRALLSSVIEFIKQVGEQLSVAVFDDYFFNCDEYNSLAKSVRAFTLVTSRIDLAEKFADEIYREYGLRVVIRQLSPISYFDLSLDFSGIKKDGSLNIIYRGESMLIYPDNKYFESDNDVLELMKHGVPIKCACAVLRDNNYMA